MRILVILFLFFSVLGNTQSWKPKYDQFFAELQQADYQTAVKTGTALLDEMERDTAWADVCFYVANTFSALQDFQSAIKYAEQEKRVREIKQGNRNGYYMNSIYYLGGYYSAIGDFDHAIPLFLEVYAEQNRQYPKNHLNTIIYGNYIAEVYTQAGALKKAQEMYEYNYEIIRSSYSPTDSVYIEMLYTLSNFYTQNGMFERAIPFYKTDCDMQKKNYGEKSDQYLTAINQLGELCIYAGKYDEAEKVFTEFVKLAEAKYGKKHVDYATSLNNLAVVYEKQNRFKEAEELYLKALAIKEKVYKKESETYALSLINLGATYDYMGKYTEAEKVLNEALFIYEKLNLTETENYATALSNIASIYSSTAKYDKAISVLKNAMEICKNKSGEKSIGYLTAINNLGAVYQAMANYDEALNIYLEAEQLYKSVFGDEHTEYGVVLFNIGNSYSAKGEYDKAIEYFDRDLKIQEKAVGQIHLKYANAMMSKASALISTGNSYLAESLFEECDEIYSRLYGKMHPEYAIYLNNYGLYLFNRGDYYNAGEKLKDAYDIQINSFGPEHPDNISLLCNIANLEVEKNQFKEAEQNLLNALKIAKTNFKPEQPEYSTTLNNVATLYYHLGNYDKAELYWKEALELRKNYYGENHTEYAVSLNNMGTLFLGRASISDKTEEINLFTTEAISYFKKALAVDSVARGENDPERGSHFNNLAEAYRLKNEPQLAEKYYLKSLELEEKGFGKENPRSAVTYHNLALLYTGMKELDKAENAALTSISVFEKNYGKQSSAASGVTASLAFIYESSSKNEKAKSLYLDALSRQRILLEQNFSFLSETEKENYLSSVFIYNDMFNSFALKTKAADPAITQMVYDNELYNKGILFRSSSRVKESVLASGNENLIATYNEWAEVKKELSSIYSSNKSDKNEKIKLLEEKSNELEKSMVSASGNLERDLSRKDITWKTIKTNLKPNQAVIEFIHFIRNDELKEDLYCALIITSGSSSPIMTELFTEKQIKDIIGKNTATTYESVSSLYGKQKSLNIELFSLIWGPLETSLKGITEIYYSPAGILHKISFSSIGDANGKFVSDKYILHQVNSTAAICEKSEGNTDPSQSTIAVIGGVNYDTKISSQKVWSYLPGTLTESEHIQNTLSKTGIKSTVFTADNASEENLKKMDGASSPEILHIATHGFFFGDPNEQKEKIEKQNTSVKFRGESRGIKTLVENPNPMMRSGLVLAGANDIWNDTQADYSNNEDGILTAYEVSLMNLQNTKLVVLSACETGLGDIKGTDGVYGLQRAFRMAGTDFLVMSLWQVPDKETDEFMTAFYTELVKTKDIRKSFINAQKTMRAKYDPYFWGAFVLIE